MTKKKPLHGGSGLLENSLDRESEEVYQRPPNIQYQRHVTNDGVFNLWVPDCFSPSNFSGNGERGVRLAYIAHLVTTRKPDDRGFVRLHRDVLREQTDNRSIDQFRKEFKDLLDISDFERGVRANGYRWNFGFKPIQLQFHAPRFATKLLTLREKKRREYSELEANLEQVLKGVSLGLDDVAATVATLPDKAGTKSEDHRRFIITLQGEQVKSGDFGFISTSPRTGRIHCLHNRTHKAFRELFTFDGESSSELDLASSQPWLLSRMFSCPELSRAVADGSFYKRLADGLDTPPNLDDPKVYPAFKKSALATIYRRPKKGFEYWLEGDGMSAQVWRAMDRVYPGLCAFIEGFSIAHGDKALPIELQRREAKIFVEGVLRSLYAEGIAAITLHDGLVFPSSKEGQVRAELEKRIQGGIIRGK